MVTLATSSSLLLVAQSSLIYLFKHTNTFRKSGGYSTKNMKFFQLFLCWTACYAAAAPTTSAFVVKHTQPKNIGQQRFDTSCHAFTVPGMWPSGLNFGKGPFTFYRSFDSWMKVFAEEDREAFPEVFNLPKGVYEVSMTKPLGIVFEEISAGNGIFVQDLVEGGLAERQGRIQVGDILVGITAVKIVGAKYERRLIPARKFDFDTVVGAISSNEAKWGCNDVVLQFERPGEADPAKVDEFMEFFEPPFDNPWKQQQ